MKYNKLAYLILLISTQAAYSGSMGMESPQSNGSIYVGVFGGGGALTAGNLSQKGTAFISDSSGGPLAVNATGTSKSSAAGVVGGHVGYQWQARLLNHFNPNWTIAPATELEAYYLGGATLSGKDINNGTTRLIEHDFHVSYPMQSGVFLINALLKFNHANLNTVHPYIGIGIGSALTSVSGASSVQRSPSEPNINHYNSDPSYSSTAFATQPKIGFDYNLSQNSSLFAEYRFLYLSSTNYTFGSTVYPTHVATSNWAVKIGSQYYNMGTVGIRYDI
jgi:opacity protein-like surface antigen